MAHRPIDEAAALPVIAFVNHVEFVGGPRDGESEDRETMPETIAAEGGSYRRSVRCAEDGALRYIWMDAEGGRRT